MRYNKNNWYDNRIKLLNVVFFVVTGVMVGRLFYLQIMRHEYYMVKASGQYEMDIELLQNRGEIYMRNFRDDGIAPLGTNRNLSLMYAVPSEVVMPQNIATALAKIIEPNDEERRLEIEASFYTKLAKGNDPYEPLWHRLQEDMVDEIKAKNLKGIYFKDEWVRFYPQLECGAQVAGFLGFRGDKQVGQYGIEGFFEDELAGSKGQIKGDKDVGGRIIPVADSEMKEAQDGSDIVLTLDKVIQEKACQIISEAVDGYGAKTGSIIVMDPGTGNIKAMASFPSFDPNNYSQVDNIEIFKNPVVTSDYEPGSIFKVIDMAAGIDSGAVKPSDTYFDKGYVKFGENIIRNAQNRDYGEIDMAGVLENSVNTGAVHVAMLTGKEIFKDYVERFGFGSETGIELPGEVSGDISSLDKKGDIYLATASFGQGITVTPIQMISAVSSIVNGGKKVRPHVVERIENSDGSIYIENSDLGEQVISKETSSIIKAMMVSVVKNGQGSHASVSGYYIGGKTGTAEVAGSGGYGQDTIHSFVGFGPLEDSKFVILVRLDEPKWGSYSSVTAAPTFAKMAEFLLQYYQVAPEASSDL